MIKEEIIFVREQVASKLRGLRAEKNMSQIEIAEKTGLDIATISRYENGTVTQSLDKLIALSKFYDVKLIYFFT